MLNTIYIITIVFACLFAAVLLGRYLQRFLPEHHLNSDTKDTVKLSAGLIATMTALLLGLLVSSAKDYYDTTRNEVTQMASKILLLDRIMKLYGPETKEFHDQFRASIDQGIHRLWPNDYSESTPLTINTQAGNMIYFAIQNLTPHDESQRNLKSQAMSLALELGQIQSLLVVQAVQPVSMPLLIMVICWLVVIFLSFSLIAPRNATATVALIISALSVSGAVFLILELARPFGGLLRISSQPMINALNLITK